MLKLQLLKNLHIMFNVRNLGHQINSSSRRRFSALFRTLTKKTIAGRDFHGIYEATIAIYAWNVIGSIVDPMVPPSVTLVLQNSLSLLLNLWIYKANSTNLPLRRKKHLEQPCSGAKFHCNCYQSGSTLVPANSGCKGSHPSTGLCSGLSWLDKCSFLTAVV